MSKQVGFYYGSNTITKHEDSYFKEIEEECDYVNNERRYRMRFQESKKKQTGKDWTTGLGFFPKSKPALPEGNTCTTVATKDDNGSTIVGVKYGSKDLTPKEGGSDSNSDEEVTDCPANPKRPGLRYKRTRRRKSEFKQGDHVSQSSFGIGFNW